MIHAPRSAPAVFVGTVDASRDRSTPTPRTLRDAFGPAADYGVLAPMDDDSPLTLEEKAVFAAYAFALIFLAGLLLYEWITA
ncbi:MAG: hypothetical protein QM586_11630 [Xenophilus sp.]